MQRNAIEVWKDPHKDFQTTLAHDSEVLKYLSSQEVATAFDVRHQLRHLDYIFERVFGK